MKPKFLTNFSKASIFQQVGQRVSEKITIFFLLNFSLVMFQFLYLYLRYKNINETVPIWYTQPWGDFQLGTKLSLISLPLVSALIIIGGILFLFFMRKYYVRYLGEITTIFVTTSIILLTFSLLRIISLASFIETPLVSPLFMELAVPFVVAFIMVLVIAPFFIEFAKKKNIITNPAVHNHPGMILLRPSARGGGSVFIIGFIITSLLFVPVTQQYFGIYFVALLLALVGFIDDFQNTHPKSPFRLIEAPFLRLFMLLLIVSLIFFFGVKIEFISSPFGGIIEFTNYTLQIGDYSVSPLSAIITIFWIVWVLNVLSWSNGIDGQFSGIVGIAAIVVSLLALRFIPLEKVHLENAKLAIILAGASLGILPFTWHPSRMMWGFGSVSAAFVLSTLSILVSSKVATSIIIILIPFLDALVTILRRVLQGKNPLKGDRGHLHHLLLERGWGIKKIAIFYWVSTAFFGIIALLASERTLALLTLMSAGIVAFIIIVLNLRSIVKKRAQPKAV